MSKQNDSRLLEERLRSYLQDSISQARQPADLWSKLESRLEAPTELRPALTWPRLLSPAQWRLVPALALAVALVAVASGAWILAVAPWQASPPSTAANVPPSPFLVNGDLAVADPDGAWSLEVRLDEEQDLLRVPADESPLGIDVTRSAGPTLATSEAGAPSQGLFLSDLAPSEGTFTNAKFVTVSGRTSPDAVVLVGWVVADVLADGEFSAELPLEEGSNVFQVAALREGQEVMGEISVVRADEARTVSASSGELFIEVLSPSDGSIVSTRSVVIAGQTSANAVVLVGDGVAQAGPDGMFSVQVSLDVGPNVVVIMAADDTGTMEAVLMVYSEPGASV